MNKIYCFTLILILYTFTYAQPQVTVHNPPIPFNGSAEWGTDLQIINSEPEGKFSGIRRGPGDTIYLAMPDTNTLANRNLLILKTTNNGSNWSIILSVQPAAIVEKTRMVMTGMDSIYCVMLFGGTFQGQLYILRITGTPLLTPVLTGGYRDFDAWGSSTTNGLYLFLDSLGSNSIIRYSTIDGGASYTQRGVVSSTSAHPFVAKSGQGDTSILSYYQITVGITDTLTAAITTAKYRETSAGVLGSGNFNTSLIPAGTQKEQFENATYGGITWLLYTEGTAGSRDIKYYISTNGGTNFTGPNTLAGTTVDEYYFDIKSFSAGSGGVDVIYFKDSTGSTNTSDRLVYTSAVTTLPTTFAAPVAVSENRPITSTKNYYPELIEYLNTGDVAAVWTGMGTSGPGVFFDRLSAIVGIKEKENTGGVPETYKLSQNYPNPFNPKTIIEFSIPKNEIVTIKLYDILGKEIAVLLDKQMTAGSYSMEFDGTSLASGVYFYKIISGSFTDTKKMILSK